MLSTPTCVTSLQGVTFEYGSGGGGPNVLQQQEESAGTEDSAMLLGMSASQLNALFTDTRNPNVHTRPPPKRPKKMEPFTPYNNTHLNYFLRCYLRSQGPSSLVPEEALRSCLDFCVANDSEFVSKIQQQSIKSFLRELEGKTFSTAASGQSKGEDPPVTLSHVRRVLPNAILKGTIPQLSTSPLHFKFVVDTSSAASSQVKYFSGQVSIKNEGSSSMSIQILQRSSIVDGVMVNHSGASAFVAGQGHAPSVSNGVGTTGAAKDTDFQVFLDKNSLAKKTACTILLSLIAQPSAVFGYVLESVVVLVNGVLPLVVTFAVINPSLPIFGTPFPGALAVPEAHSPLGQYHAPVALELLRTLFVEQDGHQSKNILHVLESSMFASASKAALLEAHDIRVTLDDLGLLDILNVAALTESSTGSGGAGSVGGSASAGKAKDGQEEEPLTRLTSTEEVTDSPPLPANTTVNTLLPSSSRVTFKVPLTVASMHPAATMQLILMWLAECPTPLVDQSLINCDPFVYLETVNPCVQGTLLWCIDFCCLLLVNQRRIQHHRTASMQDSFSSESGKANKGGSSTGAGTSAGSGTSSSPTGTGATAESGNVATLTAIGSGSISVRVLALTMATVIASTYKPGCIVGSTFLSEAQRKRLQGNDEDTCTGSNSEVTTSTGGDGAGERGGSPPQQGEDVIPLPESLPIVQYLTTAFVHWICRCIECYD